jgi:hypothetical protein
MQAAKIIIDLTIFHLGDRLFKRSRRCYRRKIQGHRSSSAFIVTIRVEASDFPLPFLPRFLSVRPGYSTALELHLLIHLELDWLNAKCVKITGILWHRWECEGRLGAEKE